MAIKQGVGLSKEGKDFVAHWSSDSDGFDLYSGAFGQRGDLNGGAGRKWLAEVASVYSVHCAEIGQVDEENGGFNDVGESHVVGTQHPGEVFKNPFGLGGDVALDEFTGGRVERDLAGAKEHVPTCHSLRIRANGFRGFGSGNDFFHKTVGESSI